MGKTEAIKINFTKNFLKKDLEQNFSVTKFLVEDHFKKFILEETMFHLFLLIIIFGINI